MAQAEFRVAKLDAAKRQLETAIRLYFASADPVSIHTLTAAAYQLLLDLNKKAGGEPMFMKQGFLALFRPDQRKAVTSALNAPENFFKHADNDPDGTYTLRTGLTELFMLDAVETYQALTGELFAPFGVFKAWFMHEAGKQYVLPQQQEVLRQRAVKVFPHTRHEFFIEVLPMALSLVGPEFPGA
jgi:hypothetical protein